MAAIGTFRVSLDGESNLANPANGPCAFVDFSNAIIGAGAHDLVLCGTAMLLSADRMARLSIMLGVDAHA